MLLEKLSYSENDIVTLKLISGEEVIGKFISEDSQAVTLDKPLTLAMSQKGVGMVPLLMTVNPDNKLKINRINKKRLQCLQILCLKKIDRLNMADKIKKMIPAIYESCLSKKRTIS